MTDQSRAWSDTADDYEEEFVDPYRSDVHNPLFEQLKELSDSSRIVADLGCGVGPLLPTLSERFEQVHAIDFAPGMLKRAKRDCQKYKNIKYHSCELTKVHSLKCSFDVAIAVNSLVMVHPTELQQSIESIYNSLRPGGVLMGIVPAMDSVHYHTMLLVDRALKTGMPLDKAQKNAAEHAEHHLFEPAFGEFRYRGLVQHFWQPFEIDYRLTQAGFETPELIKVHLTWDQFAEGKELQEFIPPWDWFFSTRKNS